MKTQTVFGLNVFNDSLESLKPADRCQSIITISPNSYGIGTKNSRFMDALRHSDILVLDGVYFTLATLLKGKGAIRTNNGPSTFKYFMDKMQRNGGRVFFLGSTEETLRKISRRVEENYSNIAVGTYSPPYKAEFSETDNKMMIDAINAFEPTVVFVGMTAPKQEIWSFENRWKIKADFIIAVGAVFDWFAGNQKEIAPIWWKLHLGWLIRTIHRPEILKRYPNIGIFFWHLFLDITRIRRIS